MRRFLRSAGLSVAMVILLSPGVACFDPREDKTYFFTVMIALLVQDYLSKRPCEREPQRVNHISTGVLWDSTAAGGLVETSVSRRNIALFQTFASPPFNIQVTTSPGINGNIEIYYSGSRAMVDDSPNPALLVDADTAQVICVRVSAGPPPEPFFVQIN